MILFDVENIHTLFQNQIFMIIRISVFFSPPFYFLRIMKNDIVFCFAEIQQVFQCSFNGWKYNLGKGSFTNYVGKRWQVGGTRNVNGVADFPLHTNKGISSLLSTRGGQLVKNGKNLVNVVIERPFKAQVKRNLLQGIIGRGYRSGRSSCHQALRCSVVTANVQFKVHIF